MAKDKAADKPADLHAQALTAVQKAIEAVQAFRDHPVVVDDTTLHATAKHADLQLDHALAALHGVAQAVVDADPPPEVPPATPPTRAEQAQHDRAEAAEARAQR